MKSIIKMLKGTSINTNNLDNVKFCSYSDFFKLRYSRSYIQFKKIAIWVKYNISYLFCINRGSLKALFKKTIILMISLFYLISCLNDEKPKEKIINKNTAKIKITKSKKIYNIKVEEKGRTKDKSYYYSYSKKDKSLDDNKINSALNANLNVKDFDTSKKANNIKKNLSKNFIIKCSACHSNYANGIIGPSLLNKSAKDIFTLMMKYKNNEKSNALMDALIQNMSVKEIKDISYEISQLNKG